MSGNYLFCSFCGEKRTVIFCKLFIEGYFKMIFWMINWYFWVIYFTKWKKWPFISSHEINNNLFHTFRDFGSFLIQFLAFLNSFWIEFNAKWNKKIIKNWHARKIKGFLIEITLIGRKMIYGKDAFLLLATKCKDDDCSHFLRFQLLNRMTHFLVQILHTKSLFNP